MRLSKVTKCCGVLAVLATACLVLGWNFEARSPVKAERRSSPDSASTARDDARKRFDQPLQQPPSPLQRPPSPLQQSPPPRQLPPTPSQQPDSSSQGAQAAVPRCSLYQDVQGAWIPADVIPPRAPYNCSAIIPGLEAWTCWDQLIDRPWGARPAHHNLARAHDRFDTTRAPPSLACTVDPLPANVEAVRHLLHNRSILFVGDSLSEQMTYTMSCELWSVYGIRLGKRTYDVDLCDMGTTDDIFLQSLNNYSCDSYHRTNGLFFRACCRAPVTCFATRPQDPIQFRFCHVFSSAKNWASAAKITYATVKRFGVGPRDVLVANEGVHYLINQEDFFRFRYDVPPRAREWLFVLRRLRDELGDRAPRFMWSETIAQHFISNRGTGEFPPIDKPNTCGEITRPNNTLNRITVPIIEAARIPILRLWNATAPRYFEHPELLFTGNLDCTHFCLPSAALRHFVRLILHSINSLRLEGGLFGSDP